MAILGSLKFIRSNLNLETLNWIKVNCSETILETVKVDILFN